MTSTKSTIREINLDIPFDKTAIKEVRPGDAVLLNGTIFTGREGVYRQIFENKLEPPIDIRNTCPVNFHCSPAVSEPSPGEYKIPSVTATASFRFARYIKEFIERYGIQAVIGKGGMSDEVYASAFEPNGTLYLTTAGYGLGALYGKGIKRVKDVAWKEELGLAQAMWILEVEHFGPLLVECDVRGDSLFTTENEKINPLFKALYRDLPLPALKRLGEEVDPAKEMI